jgi:hypothetical protein
MLAKAVAHHTTAAFIRVVGSEFVQKYLGEVSGAFLVEVGCLSVFGVGSGRGEDTPGGGGVGGCVCWGGGGAREGGLRGGLGGGEGTQHGVWGRRGGVLACVGKPRLAGASPVSKYVLWRLGWSCIQLACL